MPLRTSNATVRSGCRRDNTLANVPAMRRLHAVSGMKTTTALRHACADDLKQAMALPIENVGNNAVVVFMPEAAWSRRIAGTFANALSRRHPDRTVALLVRGGAGYQVNLRAPEHGGSAVHLLARQFESGNGRARSAGIQFLPEADVARLFALLRHPFAAGAPESATGH